MANVGWNHKYKTKILSMKLRYWIVKKINNKRNEVIISKKELENNVKKCHLCFSQSISKIENGRKGKK